MSQLINKRFGLFVSCFFVVAILFSLSSITNVAIAQEEEEQKEEEPVKLQVDISQLKASKQVEAEYPSLALKAYAEGSVDVEVTVDTEGKVSNVDVVSVVVTFNNDIKNELKKAQEEARKTKNKNTQRNQQAEEEEAEETEEVEELSGEEEEAAEEEESEADEELAEVEEAEEDEYSKMALEGKINDLFQESAIKAAKQWEFVPMKGKDGKPISVVAPLQFSFNLQVTQGNKSGK